MCVAKVLNCWRIFFMTVATFTLLCALVLNAIAALFPAWQVVEITELGQIHKHGLWMYCVDSIPGSQRTALGPQSSSLNVPVALAQLSGPSSKDESQCFLKDQSSSDEREAQHHFHTWQRTTLILLIISFALGLLTLFNSFCGFCIKWFTLAWTSGTLLSFGTSLAALLVAFLNGYSTENRVVQISGLRSIYNQELGFAFWCCLASTATYLLTVVLAACVTITTFLYARQTDDHNSPQTWPKNGHTMV